MNAFSKAKIKPKLLTNFPGGRIIYTYPQGYGGECMRQCMDAKNLHQRLSRIRGQINAMDSTTGARIVKAFVPLAEQFGYVTVLRTISSGRATSTMTFDHYAEVPANLAKEVIEKSGYKNVDEDE